MSKTAVRTDGEFGQYYADTANIRAVIAAYRADTGCSYRQAWQAWMGWSGVKMTYTDSGTKVKYDWLPLAAANGIEWMGERYEFPDRFCNLYRRKFSLNGTLWYAGAFCQYLGLRLGGKRWL